MTTPQDGVFYTLEQVAAAGFLGDDVSVEGIRKAIKRHNLPHTRRYGGTRIGLTKANIEAILARGDQDAGEVPVRRTPRRTRAAAPPESLPPGVQPLRPRPEAARRRAS